MLAHSYFIKDPYRKSFHYTISAYFVLFFRFFILVSLLPCFRAEFSVDSWKLSVVCDNGQEQQVSVLQATESLWLSVQAVSHEIHGDHTKTNEKKKNGRYNMNAGSWLNYSTLYTTVIAFLGLLLRTYFYVAFEVLISSQFTTLSTCSACHILFPYFLLRTHRADIIIKS